MLAQQTVGAGLALKYEFIPKRDRLYQAVNNNRPNVQVIAARNYVDKQPLAETISYSYKASSAPVYPVSVIVAPTSHIDKQPFPVIISYSYDASAVPFYPVSVIAAPKNYAPQNVVVMNSQVQEDFLEFYVAGYAFNDEGYVLESKDAQQQIESAIAKNSLDGCAPLNINCSRTASESSKLSIERGPIEAAPSAPKSQRQLLSE